MLPPQALGKRRRSRAKKVKKVLEAGRKKRIFRNPSSLDWPVSAGVDGEKNQRPSGLRSNAFSVFLKRC
jgi:hypothetical protein